MSEMKMDSYKVYNYFNLIVSRLDIEKPSKWVQNAVLISVI